MADPAPAVQFTNPNPFTNVSQPSAPSPNVSSRLVDGANHTSQDVGHNQVEEQTERLESPTPPKTLDPPQTDGQNTNTSGQKARRILFGDPPRESNPKRFLGSPALPTEKFCADISVRERSSEPILKRSMHWVSRRVMIGCLAIAIALMLGQHFWFNSRVNQIVGDRFEQQRTRL